MRFYKILKAKQCGNAEGLTAYERQFVEYLKKIDIKTITGVLPLTFTAKGGTAVDWVIEGNDSVGENMMPLVTEANGWRTGYRDKAHGHYGAGQYIGEFLSPSVSVDDNTTFTIKAGGMNPEYASYESGTVYFFDDSNTYIGYADFNNYSGSAISVPLGATTFDFAIRTGYTGFPAVESSDFWVMLVKGSTAPDHYIPYQQGVGQKTKNMLDTQAYEVGKAWNTSSNANRATATLTVKPNTTYTLKVFETVADLVYIGVKESADATTAVASQQTVNGTVTITTTASAYTLAIQLNKTAITLNDCQNCKITLTEGSTAPSSYIPYGYEIPISVSGENLFDSNTMIDTNITNKYLKNDGTMGDASPWGITTYIPITADRIRLDNITGGAASICCYDANKNFIRGQQYYHQSPILLNTSDATFVRFSLTPNEQSIIALFGLNDYTFYIGSSPLRAGQSISKTSTGVDIELFEGENTVSTTLYNKPAMEIKYK